MNPEASFPSRAGSRRIAPLSRSLWLALGTVSLLGMTACASSGSTSAAADPALNTPSSATEPLKKAPTPEFNKQMPKSDPREGLGAGLLDAEEAIWNLSLVSATPPPAEFVGVSNSDLAFTGKYAIQGNYNGFQVWDISNPSAPVLVKGYVCPASQSDVSVYKHLLFVSGEGFEGRLDCGTEGVQEQVSAARLRGIRIFDITDIANPVYIGNVQTCRGSHTHSVLVDPNDKENVYVYVSGSAPVRPEEELPGCSGLAPDEDPNSALFRIEVIRVPLANPEAAAIVSSPRIFQDLVEAPEHGPSPADIRALQEAEARGAFMYESQGQRNVLPDGYADMLLAEIVSQRGGTGAPTAADSMELRENLQAILEARFGGDDDEEAADGPRPGPTQCHDITLYPEIGLAGGACEGYGLLIDISDPVNPKRIAAVSDSNFSYWHSATFNNDGSSILFSDEWGGGGGPKCRAGDPYEWGANAIFTVVDSNMQFQSYYKMPAVQTSEENCVAHNGSLIPIPGRDVMVQSWYQGGVSVFDFTDPANPIEIAYFDRGPVDATRMARRRHVVRVLVQRTDRELRDRARSRHPRAGAEQVHLGERDRGGPDGHVRPLQRAGPANVRVAGDVRARAGVRGPAGALRWSGRGRNRHGALRPVRPRSRAGRRAPGRAHADGDAPPAPRGRVRGRGDPVEAGEDGEGVGEGLIRGLWDASGRRDRGTW